MFSSADLSAAANPIDLFSPPPGVDGALERTELTPDGATAGEGQVWTLIQFLVPFKENSHLRAFGARSGSEGDIIDIMYRYILS